MIMSADDPRTPIMLARAEALRVASDLMDEASRAHFEAQDAQHEIERAIVRGENREADLVAVIGTVAARKRILDLRAERHRLVMGVEL